jgi:subtilase family serine protease
MGVLASCAQTDETTAPLGAVFPGAASAQGVMSVRPAWATADHFVEQVAAQEQIAIQVHLRMRNEAAAMAELASISDPENQNFGKFLSDDQFNAKYAPTDADVAAVRAHLEGAGLTVTDVPANHTYLAATGEAAQIERAFATALGHYAVDGKTLLAPMSAPALPSAVSSKVLSVVGLSSQRQFKPHYVRTRSADGEVSPHDRGDLNTCSEWFGEKAHVTNPAFPGIAPPALIPCGYYPAQLRRAYGLADTVRHGNDGTGVSVAIVDAFLSPTLFVDAQTYAAQNDPEYPLDAAHFTALMAPGIPQQPDIGWYGEQTLDVEAVHAMAPGAKIVYVGAQSAQDTDLIAAINLIIQLRLATVISNSYGSFEDPAVDNTPWHSIATQAGLKGIGLYFSSGDNGDYTLDPDPQNPAKPPYVSMPAALDNVVAVGGTALALGQTGNDQFEIGWANEKYRLLPAPAPTAPADTTTPPPAPTPALVWTDVGFVGGAGGGASKVYRQPAWQKGIVPPALSTTPSGAARVLPDVAMLADPYTGFVIGESDPDPTSPTYKQYGESSIGGTSLACPLFAGTIAVAQQRAGRKLGFTAPLLYKAYKKSGAAFRDIAPITPTQAVSYVNPAKIETVVTLDFQGQGLIHTAPGFDTVTGLGAPNGTTFLDAIVKARR